MVPKRQGYALGDACDYCRNVDLTHQAARLQGLRRPREDPRHLVNPDGSAFVGEATTVFPVNGTLFAWSQRTDVVHDPRGPQDNGAVLYVQDGRLMWADGTQVEHVTLCTPDPPTVRVHAQSQALSPLDAAQCPTAPGAYLDPDCAPHALPPDPRGYVYTVVKRYGSCPNERIVESPPSPVVSVLVPKFGHVELTAPTDEVVRWYRILPNRASVFVGEAAGPLWDDADPRMVGDSFVKTWDHRPAPNCAKGVVRVDDRSVMVYTDHELHVSEPNNPHAYVIEPYRIPDKIKRVVTFDPLSETADKFHAVVLTDHRPYIVRVDHSSDPAVRVTCVDEQFPLADSLAVCDANGRLFYAGVSGLIGYNGSSFWNVSAELMTEQEWQSFLPSSLCYAEDRIFAKARAFSWAMEIPSGEVMRPPYLTITDDFGSTHFQEHSAGFAVREGTPYRLNPPDGARLEYEYQSQVYVTAMMWRPLVVIVEGEWGHGRPWHVAGAHAALTAWRNAHPGEPDTTFYLLNPNYRAVASARRSVALDVISDRVNKVSLTVDDARPHTIGYMQRSTRWAFRVRSSMPIEVIDLGAGAKATTDEGGSGS